MKPVAGPSASDAPVNAPPRPLASLVVIRHQDWFRSNVSKHRTMTHRLIKNRGFPAPETVPGLGVCWIGERRRLALAWCTSRGIDVGGAA